MGLLAAEQMTPLLHNSLLHCPFCCAQSSLVLWLKKPLCITCFSNKAYRKHVPNDQIPWRGDLNWNTFLSRRFLPCPFTLTLSYRCLTRVGDYSVCVHICLWMHVGSVQDYLKWVSSTNRTTTCLPILCAIVLSSVVCVAWLHLDIYIPRGSYIYFCSWWGKGKRALPPGLVLLRRRQQQCTAMWFLPAHEWAAVEQK
jgi:hypothetical protein